MTGVRSYLKLLLSWSLATWYIEALTRPDIRFMPEQTAYIVGERLTMRCVADNPTTVTGYTFYKDAAGTSNNTSSNILTFNLKTSDSGMYFCTYFSENGQKSPESKDIYLNVFEQPPAPSLIMTINLKTSDSGMYVCIYYMENGRKSPESQIIDLKVFEQPPAPSLSVTPQRSVFVKDQSAVLRCLLPNIQTSAVTGITLYQNHIETYESDNVGVLNYSNLQLKNTGNYSCSYTMLLSGRTIQSNHSEENALIVIEKPPTPMLRYAFNNQSKQVRLTCEVQNTSFYLIHGYHFYRNGEEIQSTNQVNAFTFNYTLIFDGCYSCKTFVTILGEEILSAKSFEHFLPVEGRVGRQCQKNMFKGDSLSKQDLKFYGSILAGKLLVLISILAIFGVYLLVIQQRNQKPVAE
ncbi:uncharacterized protein ACMZJ9_001181 [Mantella aurantiaca]